MKTNETETVITATATPEITTPVAAIEAPTATKPKKAKTRKAKSGKAKAKSDKPKGKPGRKKINIVFPNTGAFTVSKALEVQPANAKGVKPCELTVRNGIKAGVKSGILLVAGKVARKKGEVGAPQVKFILKSVADSNARRNAKRQAAKAAKAEAVTA